MIRRFEQIERETHPWVSTGSFALNKLLGGGLPLHYHTQFYGESKTGKSRLALQLILNGSYNRYKEAVYRTALVTVGGKADLEHYWHLNQLMEPRPLESIIRNANSYSQLEQVLTQLGKSAEEGQLRLLVIDSIGATTAWQSDQGYEFRDWFFCRFKALLKNYPFALVTFNEGAQDYRSGKIIPALGEEWSERLHQQLELQRLPRSKGRVRWVRQQIAGVGQQIQFKVTGMWIIE